MSYSSANSIIWDRITPTTVLTQVMRIYLTAELRKKIENLKILLNDEKIKNLRGEDSLFYHSLYFGSIVLYGEEDEI